MFKSLYYIISYSENNVHHFGQHGLDHFVYLICYAKIEMHFYKPLNILYINNNGLV